MHTITSSVPALLCVHNRGISVIGVCRNDYAWLDQGNLEIEIISSPYNRIFQ